MYRARICKDGKELLIGYYSTLNSAVLARYNKELEFNFGECNTKSSAYLYLKGESNGKYHRDKFLGHQ
jgi:hypothetical protein